MAAPVLAHARSLSHFPIELGERLDHSPAVVDLDGDGAKEIVIAGGDRLFVVDARGEIRPGFPVALGAAAAGAPAVARVRAKERVILALSRAGVVHLVGADGAEIQGYPVSMGRPLAPGGALVDVDGDGVPEAVVATRDGRVHALRLVGRKAGRDVPGFPVRVRGEVSAAPTFVDLGREKPRRLLLIPGADGTLRAVTTAGRREGTFAPRSRFEIQARASSADLDRDGQAEVVFGSGDFGLYLVDASGKVRDGFPLQTGYRIRSAPALGDLDGDGRQEIVVTSMDGKLYAVDLRGRVVTGFPVSLGGKPAGSVVLGDLSGDSRPEIVGVTRHGRVFVYDAEGKPVHGWESDLGAPVEAGPALVDLDGNGELEIVVGTLRGQLAVLTGRGAKAGRAIWPLEGFDPERSGWRHPVPTVFSDLHLTPAQPTTLDPLRASWRRVDLDRKKGRVEISWWRDGKEVGDLRGKSEVPAERTHKRERWHFELKDLVDGRRARVFKSPERVIRNTPPTVPGIVLGPKTPRTGQAIEVQIVAEASDVDQEPLHYVYTWYRDGERVTLAEDARSVPGRLVHKGQVWKVEVRARDDEVASVAAEATLRVGNTAPGKVAVELAPETPGVVDPIEARVDLPEKDIDGDPLHAHFSWSIDGAPAHRPSTDPVLPAGVARKHQRVGVTLTVSDGESEGPPVTAEVTVANTPPSAPKIAILPAAPKTGEALRAVLRSPASDPDEDPLTYTYRWQVGGEARELEGPSVPGRLVHAGERWKVEVVASDGEATSAPARAAIDVVHAPPRPPVVAIEPIRPRPGEALHAVVVQPATDRDGDAVSLRWQWLRDGKEAAKGASVGSGRTRRGELWTVVVTPYDAHQEGRPSRASVRIGNRPPGRPAVRLLPATPHAGQSLHAKVVLASDPDGDPVKARLEWWVDGEHIEALDDARVVPAERVHHFETWEVVVRGDDGSLRSAPTRAATRIADRPPASLATRVTPPRARTNQDLKCEPKGKASDPDGDAVVVRFRWVRGTAETAWSGSTLPASATRKGESWSCWAMVEALGKVTVGPRSKPVVIADAPPRAGNVAIEPAHPRTEEPLRCVVTRPFTDPDGDAVRDRMRWRVDGKPAKVKGAVVPPARTRRGERWRCTVVGSDGEMDSEAVSAEVTIVNSPPSAPVVRLQPESPVPGRPLRCELVQRSRDADGDRLEYRFRWYLEGKAQPFAPTSVAVPVRLLKPGQTWQCGVAAFDGMTEGPEGRSARKEVRQEAR